MGELRLIQNQQQLIDIFKEPPPISYRKGNTLRAVLLERGSEGQITTKCMSRVLPSPIFEPGNLGCVKFDSMLSWLSHTKGVKVDQRGSQCTSIFTSPHPPIPCHHASWKSAKITFSSIPPYSHSITFSPSSLHFHPDFSLLPFAYLPSLSIKVASVTVVALWKESSTFHRLALDSIENSAQCLFYIFQTKSVFVKGAKIDKNCSKLFLNGGWSRDKFLNLPNEWDLGLGINQDGA